MSLRLPDRGSFEDLLRPTRIDVASLVRLSRYPASETYGSAGVYRFDDPDPGGADAFGTCYAANAIEVAFAASVIHECGRFVGGSCEVPAVELTERSVVRFACERRQSLVLADPTGAALKALGLNNDISASADCTTSQAWARAIHSASLRWDGIRFVSRQTNKGFAFAIFERSALRKLRAEKLKARQVDDLCPVNVQLSKLTVHSKGLITWQLSRSVVAAPSRLAAAAEPATGPEATARHRDRARLA